MRYQSFQKKGQLKLLKKSSNQILWPKISIITPSFNQGEYIEETILSILNQSYKNFELIIIDGGSKDNTIEIIKKHEKHIAYWVSEPDKGQTDAILKGLNKCTGEIFNWINSDDCLTEDSLFTIAEQYVNNNKPGLIAGNLEFFNNNKKIKVLPHINNRNNLALTMGMGEMRQPSMFYRTDIIKRIKLNTSLHYSMDVDLYFRFNFMTENPTVVYIDKVLAAFRLHYSSKTTQEITQNTNSKFFNERVKIFFTFIKLYGDNKIAVKFIKIFPFIHNNIALSNESQVIMTVKRKSLFNKTVNYFLLENFLEALYIFDKKKLISLITSINWLKIQPQFIFLIIRKLSFHFYLFLKNKFRKN